MTLAKRVSGPGFHPIECTTAIEFLGAKNSKHSKTQGNFKVQFLPSRHVCRIEDHVFFVALYLSYRDN